MKPPHPVPEEPSENSREQAWVLLSASADQAKLSSSSPVRQEIHADRRLLDCRHRNLTDPVSLNQRLPKPATTASRARIAVVLPGDLRCIQRSRPLLQALGEQADLFVVTRAAHAQAAAELAPPERLTIVDNDPEARVGDAALPLGAMKQWHKLALALELVQQEESRRQRRYSHILKLRSDYFYVHPRQLLSRFVASCRALKGGLVGSSDKVFGGPRDLMLLLQSFHTAIPGWFDQQEQRYWPINLQQVLASDDAIKWYGFNWPMELIGQPSSTEQWREQLVQGGQQLAIALRSFQPGADAAYHRLFRGHDRFASEVCFARFLNFTGIPFRECRSLRGFLYSDRSA